MLIIMEDRVMKEESYVDLEKLNKVKNGHEFEYKDVVSEELPNSRHASGGAAFKEEVESGKYDGITVSDPGASHIVYKKM